MLIDGNLDSPGSINQSQPISAPQPEALSTGNLQFSSLGQTVGIELSSPGGLSYVVAVNNAPILSSIVSKDIRTFMVSDAAVDMTSADQSGRLLSG